MDRVKIHNSSHISEAGYDAAVAVLEIMFSDGKVYHYFDVPKNVADGLFNPPGGSAGEYFHRKIHRVYQVARL